MARLCGVCCGLLVFSATVLSGLFAGNPVEKIILRSVVGLSGGYVLGCIAGWIALVVVNDKANANASEPTPIAASSENSNGNGRSNGRPHEPQNGRS